MRNAPNLAGAPPPEADTQPAGKPFLGQKKIFQTWWPLAGSWLLMGLELPLVSAAIARLADPQINLAAYGGIVFSLALIIEAPIIMMLAASTALVKDQNTYDKLWRFMMVAGGSLTVLHFLLAFTPLFYVVVEGLIGAPAALVGPAQIGLRIMLPWTWCIAYRRFYQGILIRFGHSRSVGLGTAIRLAVNLTLLVSGVAVGRFPGIIIAPTAVIGGVVAEALFIGLRSRPVIQREIPPKQPTSEPLTYPGILRFYIPLALTSLLFLLVQPLGSAALSRMPSPIPSLAAWPVLSGFIFIFRSLGIAYNEVVVALLDEPGAGIALRKFANNLAIFVTGLIAIFVITPLSRYWFGNITGLPGELASLAQSGLLLGLLWPALNVYQNWFQGAIVYSQRTRAIPEAVVIFLVTATLILLSGVAWGKTEGIYIAVTAFVLGTLIQTGWLAYRSRKSRAEIFTRDAALPTVL